MTVCGEWTKESGMKDYEGTKTHSDVKDVNGKRVPNSMEHRIGGQAADDDAPDENENENRTSTS